LLARHSAVFVIADECFARLKAVDAQSVSTPTGARGYHCQQTEG
jgi:hypothetical protein